MFESRRVRAADGTRGRGSLRPSFIEGFEGEDELLWEMLRSESGLRLECRPWRDSFLVVVVYPALTCRANGMASLRDCAVTLTEPQRASPFGISTAAL
jgi:hypothetical protein